MITLVLLYALALDPAPVAATPAPTPVTADVAAPAAETPETAPAEQSKTAQLAERQERVGCVTRTGTRIKRKDRDNCASGRSISAEDIERMGGRLVAPANAPVPVGSGN